MPQRSSAPGLRPCRADGSAGRRPRHVRCVRHRVGKLRSRPGACHLQRPPPICAAAPPLDTAPLPCVPTHAGLAMSGAGRTARTSTASGGPRVSSQGDGIASLSLQPKLLKQINSHHTKEVRRALALGGESHDWDSGNLQHMNRQQQRGTAPCATDLPSSGSMQTPGIVSTTVPCSSSNLFKLGCAWPF